MENKKSFILYCDQKEIFSSLSDSDCKELLMAIFDFETIDINSLSPIVKIAFLPIKNQLKRDSEKWEKEIKSRSDAGKKGMASRWHNKVITKHNSVIPVITKISDNVTVNVNDNVISKDCSEVDSLDNAKKYLTKWNEVFGTQYTATRQIIKPLNEWLKDHPIEKILEAIGNIKNDPYWKNENVEPIWLLRFKDPKGEPVDRIEKFFNTKPVITYSTHLL
jgi:hypothetical protein